MTEAERLDYMIKMLEGDNARVFAEKIGVTTTILSRIRAGKLRLSGKYAKVLEAYPMINRSWLETGEGYPGDLNTTQTREHYLQIIANKDATIQVLTNELKLQQKVIEKLLK